METTNIVNSIHDFYISMCLVYLAFSSIYLLRHGCSAVKVRRLYVLRMCIRGLEESVNGQRNLRVLGMSSESSMCFVPWRCALSTPTLHRHKKTQPNKKTYTKQQLTAEQNIKLRKRTSQTH